MTVIINDFEIMVEPQASTTGAQADTSKQESASAPPPALSPQDIERIILHFEERRIRLLAD
jgi:hypothetical protein